ncbi:enoyl-CoA hydratase/isomerase family protein [Pseudonocardia sp. N23]|uniref:enoyl-CoA hydratase/isomerase family protein n=1 Tax=Pseudonocardia sp. N23 TaxID=1987376 RepID=UPI000BFCBB0B|nr:enoyl-CoA hydratase/isomerase family protein [Pseudonocardia sp. N23]GAY11971.1 enoyl-CoA hydratase [Pseudonocardia sp. N23]
MILVEQHGDVAQIVMDTPPVNAFDRAFLERLGEALAGVPARTRAVVVSSAVPRIFAAGGDIPYMARADIDDQMSYVELCQEVYGAFEQVGVPTIAAVDGACLGGGLELALSCDIRVVAPGVRLGLPESTLGILAGGGAIHRIVRAVGQAPARDMLLTGRRITGAEAVGIGLASRLAEPGTVTAAALDLAAGIATLDPDAVTAVTTTARAVLPVGRP